MSGLGLNTFVKARLTNGYVWFFLTVIVGCLSLAGQREGWAIFFGRDVGTGIAISAAVIYACYFVVGPSALVIVIALQLAVVSFNVVRMVLEKQCHLDAVMSSLVIPIIGSVVTYGIYCDACWRERMSEQDVGRGGKRSDP
jgi:hypothetical protein